MSYIDLSDHPGTTLNLIERHSIVPILRGTDAEIGDPDEGTYFRESAFMIQMDSGVEHDIEFRGLATFPVKAGTDVLLRCFAGLAPTRVLFVTAKHPVFGFTLLADLPDSPNIFQALFTNVVMDCVEKIDSYTLSAEAWEMLIDWATIANPDDEDDVVRLRVEGTCREGDCVEGDDPGGGDLSRTWAYIQISYTYSIKDVLESDDPPDILLRSHSRVLTQGNREPAGEFHYHYGAFVLDPATGGLLIEHRAGLKKILAGASVSPGGDGRPSEGSLEFRTTGELYGSVTRFATHATCCPS